MDERDSIIYREQIRPRRLVFLALFFLVMLIGALAACQADEPGDEPAAGTTEATQEPAPALAQESEPTTEPEPTHTPAEQETAEAQEEPTATSAPLETATPAETALPPPTETPSPTATPVEAGEPAYPADAPEGALVSVRMESRAGVVLDEIPEEYRDDVVQALLERPESFWQELVRRQVRLTRRRGVSPDSQSRLTLNSGTPGCPIKDRNAASISARSDPSATEAIKSSAVAVLSAKRSALLLLIIFFK